MQRYLPAILTIALAIATAAGPAIAQGAPGNTKPLASPPAVTGTIKLPQEGQSEAAELAALQAMAKVDLLTAVAAAQKALGVTSSPSSAELEGENGFLVWEVVIGDQVVIVDAGNGSILSIEAVGAESIGGHSDEDGSETDSHTDEQSEAGTREN